MDTRRDRERRSLTHAPGCCVSDVHLEPSATLPHSTSATITAWILAT